MLKRIGLALLVLVVLTACVPKQPVFMKLEKNDLFILSCFDLRLNVSEITIDAAPIGTINYAGVWSIAGPSRRAEGLQLQVGQVPAGWNEAKPPEPVAWSEVAISVTLEDVDGRSIQEVTRGSELVEGEWINSSGDAAQPSCKPSADRDSG